MATEIPNTKMYSSLICKGFVPGINKNTFFLQNQQKMKIK